jgi:cation transporter-like permease
MLVMLLDQNPVLAATPPMTSAMFGNYVAIKGGANHSRND